MKTLSKPTMRCADLLPSYEFQALSPRQKIWVQTLLESGEKTGTYDFVEATKTAYPDAHGRSIIVRSSQLQSHSKIKEILGIYFGRPEAECDPFFSELKRAIRRSIKQDGKISTAVQRAITFYAAKTGMSALPKESPEVATEEASVPAKFHVGQRITEKDSDGVSHVAEILAVDAEGRVTEWKEVTL